MKPDPDITQRSRSLLGIVNQLGKFIPHLSVKDKPLRDLLVKINNWYWGSEQQKAFDMLKQNLSSTPMLTLYNPNIAENLSRCIIFWTGESHPAERERTLDTCGICLKVTDAVGETLHLGQ